jgi:adenylyl cyclase-associated protein
MHARYTRTHAQVSGAQLYLSKDCLNVEIITAKSDSVNVHIPQSNGDFTETPVPEQFKSVIREGKLQTDKVDHSD